MSKLLPEERAFIDAFWGAGWTVPQAEQALANLLEWKAALIKCERAPEDIIAERDKLREQLREGVRLLRIWSPFKPENKDPPEPKNPRAMLERAYDDTVAWLEEVDDG